MIRRWPTAAPPTATSLSAGGARCVRCSQPVQARSICGSTITLSGARRFSAAWNTAASKPEEPASPTSASGGTTTVAPRASGASTPARFSSSTDSGSTHRWRRMARGSSAATSPQAPRRMAFSCRHVFGAREVLVDDRQEIIREIGMAATAALISSTDTFILKIRRWAPCCSSSTTGKSRFQQAYDCKNHRRCREPDAGKPVEPLHTVSDSTGKHCDADRKQTDR